ncbi:MAG: excinuclease ABC subunit UvrA, partial [Firmicutes bacterium]|nr:excinuclease ABC subunit UvrA [Bacillota bacterium]
KSGYVRVRVDGDIYDLAEEIKLEKNKKHNIEIIIDRLVIKEGIEQRLSESIEAAAALSGGIIIALLSDGEEMRFNQNFACADCGVSLEEVEPRMFSFNNPRGACEECTGLGTKMIFSPELIVPNDELSIAQGAITVSGYGNSGDSSSMSGGLFKALSERYGFSLDTPFRELSEEAKNIIFYGADEKIEVPYMSGGQRKYYSFTFEGVVNSTERRYRETTSEYAKQEYEKYMTYIECPKCKGKRLKEEILAITVGGKNISDVCSGSIKETKKFFEELELSEREKIIADQILKEINSRIGFLCNVGLDYLSLSRMAGTLSGGEAQRIRLATQIGSGLVGVLYILDEPSIGLHQRDNDKLLAALKRLRDIGNTLIVVEHDADTMMAADYIVDIGPDAGRNGGNVVFSGRVKDLLKCKNSVTGQYLSGKKKIEVPKERRKPNGKYLKIIGAKENNLKNINVEIPLGMIVCITGVSGSGKSSLINEILYKALAVDLNRAKIKKGNFDRIEGEEYLDKVICIDQSPIGRTPRSNPATYTGLFDMIRDLFAQTNEAKVRGYDKGRFSFNVKGGRCEACAGDGLIKIEMHFLSDIYVPCEVCGGKRYNRETLEVRYKGKNISEVLDMTIEEALEFFENQPRLRDKLQVMNDVGLSYIKLGQSSTTLSGGEAQRVKLATELSKRSTGKTIYVLDEPTTGLHTADVHRLTDMMQKLAQGGNTIVIIEHNLDVIKTADYIIDLGPEGGDGGGEVVACGTPEEIAENEKSYTGKYLKPLL